MPNSIRVVLLLALLSASLPRSVPSRAQSSVADAEASFRYIVTTLQGFRNTGRLANNPGIDGADLEAFLEVLEIYFQRFSAGFNRDSAMCRFYLDPENGRMTIEDKAELAFSFLPAMNERVAYYQSVDEAFQSEIADEFGSLLLNNINRIKQSTTSNQQLPARPFDEAAVIAFLDSSCTQQ